jgi:ParB family chromosome partitioning protein
MKAGLKEVPVRIRNFTEQEIVEISLIENIQREDLNPIEEALAYKTLLEKYDLTQDKVADIVSKSRTTITNSMRLLNLCDEVQRMLIDEQLTQGHARALLAIEDSEQQYIIAQKVFDEKLSVRETEKLIRDLSKQKKEKTEVKIDNEFIYRDFEEKIKNALGTKVSIKPKDNEQGKIEIEYYTSNDFERIVEYLSTLGNKE